MAIFCQPSILRNLICPLATTGARLKSSTTASLNLKRAHNAKVAGSNPAPATTNDEGLADC